MSIIGWAGRRMRAIIDFRYYDNESACDTLEDYKPVRKGKLVMTPEANVKLAIVAAMWSGEGRRLVIQGKEWGEK